MSQFALSQFVQLLSASLITLTILCLYCMTTYFSGEDHEEDQPEVVSGYYLCIQFEEKLLDKLVKK